MWPELQNFTATNRCRSHQRIKGLYICGWTIMCYAVLLTKNIFSESVFWLYFCILCLFIPDKHSRKRRMVRVQMGVECNLCLCTCYISACQWWITDAQRNSLGIMEVFHIWHVPPPFSDKHPSPSRQRVSHVSQTHNTN